MIFTNKITAVYMAEPIADLIAVSVTATMFIIQFRKILKCTEGINKICD